VVSTLLRNCGKRDGHYFTLSFTPIPTFDSCFHVVGDVPKNLRQTFLAKRLDGDLVRAIGAETVRVFFRLPVWREQKLRAASAEH